MNNRTIAAIMYDFDRTLCTRDMQEYSFIPSMGMTGREFWSYANELGSAQHMDSVLAYMYAMVKLSGDKKIAFKHTLSNTQSANMDVSPSSPCPPATRQLHS